MGVFNAKMGACSNTLHAFDRILNLPLGLLEESGGTMDIVRQSRFQSKKTPVHSTSIYCNQLCNEK